MNATLMLIGIRELGSSQLKYTKEEKQDLMHIATCALLSRLGYYSLIGKDQDGWPQWELIKPLPAWSLKEQEEILKECVLTYFKEIDY